MNSRQRRKSIRAKLREYPYTVASVKNCWDAYMWCSLHIGHTKFRINIVVDEGLGISPHIFKFSNEKDAIHFSLMWVEQ